MNEVIRTGQIKFEKSGKYRIEVGGHLDDRWSDRLAGMQIKSSSPPGDAPVTTLIGVLRDQTQLSGVLNSLYELHLPIIRVEYLQEKNGEERGPA